MRELDFLPESYRQALQRRRLLLRGWIIVALAVATCLACWLAR